MKRWILIFSSGFFLFLFFLVLDFPFERVGPQLSSGLEKGLSKAMRGNFDCQVEGLGFALPVGVKADRIACREMSEDFFDVQNLRVGLLPFYQSLAAKIGPGELSLSTNIAFGGMPSKIKSHLENVQIKQLLPVIYQMIRSMTLNVPVQPEIEGLVTGDVALPLEKLQSSAGLVKLDFKNLKVPSQPSLDLIGLSDLNFDQSEIDLSFEKGRMQIRSIAFVSKPLAFKLEGNVELQENLMLSPGDMTMKWRVQRSDALLSSLLGPQLLNAPCPNPDPQGFCTRKITRLNEIAQIFGG